LESLSTVAALLIRTNLIPHIDELWVVVVVLIDHHTIGLVVDVA